MTQALKLYLLIKIEVALSDTEIKKDIWSFASLCHSGVRMAENKIQNIESVILSNRG